MKKVSIVSLIAFVAILITSCGSSNSVVSSHSISKRKYNKGFFFKRNGNFKTADSKTKDVEVKDDKTISKAERVEKRKVKKAEKLKLGETAIAVSDADNMNVKPNQIVGTSYSNVITQQDVEITSQPKALFSDDLNGIEWSVTENESTERVESIEQMSSNYDTSSSSKNSNSGRAGSVHIVILVILALFIPPLAVFLFEGVTSRFWIDLILAVVGFGLGFGIGGLAYLAALAAVIYALLIVLGVI